MRQDAVATDVAAADDDEEGEEEEAAHLENAGDQALW